MHNKRIEKLGLQAFASTNGLTDTGQINVRVREIDFVSSFSKNIQALLDVLGITRMIKKENGSMLETYNVTGELQDGDVPEGEEIPMSQYHVEATDYGKINIEKYKKGVSIEAIARYGYDVAVDKTDQEFRMDLQNKVKGKFYKQLKSGALVGHEPTWQMAFSMAIGRVIAEFQKMGKTHTGIAAFVNTLDVYKYLGSKDIQTQTAFGMNYITGFLGADVVFLTSEIDENTVVATPLNNLVAYYVDPADSEFMRAGLAYTVDNETGVLGFHVEGDYDHAVSAMYAIMGIQIFAEYMNAIAHISVGDKDTQTLGELVVTSEEGEYEGTTVLTVEPPKSSPNNTYKVKEASTETQVTYGMNVKAWTKWDEKTPLAATNGNHITVVEADPTYKAIASGDAVAVVKGTE